MPFRSHHLGLLFKWKSHLLKLRNIMIFTLFWWALYQSLSFKFSLYFVKIIILKQIYQNLLFWKFWILLIFHFFQRSIWLCGNMLICAEGFLIGIHIGSPRCQVVFGCIHRNIYYCFFVLSFFKHFNLLLQLKLIY